MAEEPSENPEHLSFKEKLKRFQNKEASPSGSVKDNGRPNGKEIMVKVFPNAKSLQVRRDQAILKDDFSSGGSRPTLKKQDSCEVASDYLGNIGDEIKDSDFVDDVCDSKPSPVSEEILTSSDSCSNIEDSSNRNDIAKCTCTMEHELAVDSVTPHPESDCPRDETELQREDSSDQAPLQPPYPAPPYPLVDVKSFTGRSMSVGSCPPIGFEGLCDHPALSITYPSLSSHIGDTSNYSSNYMIEPKLGMPLPDFGSLHLNKDS